MTRSTTEKLVRKRQDLLVRSAAVLGIGEIDARELLSCSRKQSVRINTLRADASTMRDLKRVGWQGEPYTWFAGGYSIGAGLEAVRDSEAVAAGKVYIQNAASWLPVLALDPQPGEEILDVCAAPGGKTSHIAAMAHNRAKITANDNSRARLSKMQANLRRLGVKGVSYTLFDATTLARKLEGRQFDKILLDAPCSGEGMMDYQNDKDFATWSVAHIKRLEQLQKRIITQAWHLLKPGGTLIYSTCTMAPEENEAVVDYLLRKTNDATIEPLLFALPNRIAPVMSWNNRQFDARLQGCLRLAPSSLIEAFFVCKLIKKACDSRKVC